VPSVPAAACFRHADQPSTGQCARCAGATCALCTRGSLCVGCALTEHRPPVLGRLLRRALVVGALVAVGWGLSRPAPPELIPEAPPPPSTVTRRFVEAGIALRGLDPTLRVSLRPSGTGNRQILVRGADAKVLLRVHSIPIYPWMSHEDLGREGWSWKTGDVHLEEQGRDLPFDGNAWALAPGPWLILVKDGRFLVVSSEADLFDPAVWALAGSIQVLPDAGMRAVARRGHGLTPEQAKAAPPAKLLGALDAMASKLEAGFPQRTRVVDVGMKALKARSLDHLSALILTALLERSLRLMERHEHAPPADGPAHGEEGEEGEEDR
jgi:hypothetical protein